VRALTVLSSCANCARGVSGVEIGDFDVASMSTEDQKWRGNTPAPPAAQYGVTQALTVRQPSAQRSAVRLFMLGAGIGQFRLEVTRWHRRADIG